MPDTPPLRDIPADVFRPIRVEEFQAMVELGLFEDTHVELLGGVLVEMSPQGAPHNTVIRRLNRLLMAGLDDSLELGVQVPLLVDDISQPEPDFMIIPAGLAFDEMPSRALLVAEVSVSSRSFDMGVKARRYAAAGYPEYWVVDSVRLEVVVHTGPSPDGWQDVRTGHRRRPVPHLAVGRGGPLGAVGRRGLCASARRGTAGAEGISRIAGAGSLQLLDASAARNGSSSSIDWLLSPRCLSSSSLRWSTRPRPSPSSRVISMRALEPHVPLRDRLSWCCVGGWATLRERVDDSRGCHASAERSPQCPTKMFSQQGWHGVAHLSLDIPQGTLYIEIVREGLQPAEFTPRKATAVPVKRAGRRPR